MAPAKIITPVTLVVILSETSESFNSNLKNRSSPQATIVAEPRRVVPLQLSHLQHGKMYALLLLAIRFPLGQFLTLQAAAADICTVIVVLTDAKLTRFNRSVTRKLVYIAHASIVLLCAATLSNIGFSCCAELLPASIILHVQTRPAIRIAYV